MEIEIFAETESYIKILKSVEKLTHKPINEMLNEAIKAYVDELPRLKKANAEQTRAIGMLINKVIKTPLKYKADTLENVRLYESTDIDGVNFLRIPGGWVARSGGSMCYVPASDEFEDY